MWPAGRPAGRYEQYGREGGRAGGRPGGRAVRASTLESFQVCDKQLQVAHRSQVKSC